MCGDRRLRWGKRAGIVHSVSTLGCARLLPRLGLIGVIVLDAGCGWSGRQTSLVPVSDFARDILHVYGIIAWATLVIAAVVVGALSWVLLRFRDRPGAALPRQTRGHA